MRVAVISESFLPQVNGVTNSVARVLEHLEQRGHDAVLVAPGKGPTVYAGAPVVRVPSASLPFYPSFPVGCPTPRVRAVLEDFAPDVVHLASPIVVGAHGAAVAVRLGIPTVAVYQTDVARFAARYHLGLAGRAVWRWLRRVHRVCDRTLAPSATAVLDLRRHGVERVHLWGRGVDRDRFSPDRRSAGFRARHAPGGEVLVGYVGRLAAEKRLDRLAPLAREPGVRLVIVGDGPVRAGLERRLDGATFLGFLSGDALAEAVSSLDLFVHPGTDETFCQAAQEALCAGVPVVAPAAGGLLDLVRDGLTGRLVPPDDPDVLVDTVRALAADPQARAALAAQARPSVAARSWEVLGDQLLGHYRAVRTGGSTAEAVA